MSRIFVKEPKNFYSKRRGFFFLLLCSSIISRFMKDSQKAIDTKEELINISIGKKASQSSYSKWPQPDVPDRAVNGIKNGKFSFCTETEDKP